MEDIKVSVIIPVYGVESFIGRCAESLLNQTLDNVEFIFVNDATPDNSVNIIKQVISKYPQRADYCKIITHEENRGLPSARNTGLAHSTGDYIFHCDSDDYVEPTMLEDMYHAAIENKADIVWSDWYLTYAKTERYMHQPSYDTPLDAIKSMLSGGMKFNVWNKLVRRTLYSNNNICFPNGCGMGEDMTMIMLFVHAKKVMHLPKAYYHYVKLNSGAFSQTYSNKHLEELQCNVQRIEQYIRAHYGVELDREIAYLKLDVKFPFLISDDANKHKLWKAWYPEANRYIEKTQYISIRSYILQRLAAANQFWLISIYYKIVYKFIYNILYK